jgi:SAM-dependent methyltransferase
MSGAASSVPTSATVHGPRWGARAGDWAELAAAISVPAWEAVAGATAVGPGTRVLDVGCGSGEFCRLAADLGAAVSGIDAAEGMIAVARRQAPSADLRIGAMEALPWPEASFEVVTAFNALQFAADFLAALAEARRVTRPGGRIAICNWSRSGDNDLFTVLAPLRALQPSAATPAPPEPPAVGNPGVLESLARRAGLEPVSSAEVDTPFHAPDQRTLERALLASGDAVLAIGHSGEDAVRAALVEAAAPFRRPDGSYRFDNRFRYVVAQPSGSTDQESRSAVTGPGLA